MADDGPGLGTTLVVGVAAVIVAFMVIGWIIGTIFAVVRLVAVVVVAGAIVYALASSRIKR